MGTKPSVPQTSHVNCTVAPGSEGALLSAFYSSAAQAKGSWGAAQGLVRLRDRPGCRPRSSDVETDASARCQGACGGEGSSPGKRERPEGSTECRGLHGSFRSHSWDRLPKTEEA